MIGAVSQLIYFFPDDNLDLVYNLLKIKDSIKFINEIQIT